MHAHFPLRRVVFFVSSNIHKFHEVSHILSAYKVATVLLKKVDAVEIQDNNIERISRANAIDAFNKSGLPVVVEDAGLFVDSLNGFPGPYSSYVYKTIGNNGILRLLEKSDNRKACFKSVAAFLSFKMNEPMHFVGEVKGEIIKERQGDQGFGFDPIFKPLGSSMTFADMSLHEKNQNSHRALAFRSFAKWYATAFRSQKF